MKKIISALVAIGLITISFSGCGDSSSELKFTGTYSKDLSGTVLNVFNWGEYISDGGEGSVDVNKEFEKLTGIKVNYTNYESNEAMYAKMKSGGVSYDIIIPSDYMIERILSENMLQKIDTSKLQNYKFIDNKYKGLYFDENDEYSVPYNVGMVGLIYNKTMVKSTPDSWNIMWDGQYMNNILTFNNPRDAFAIAQILLGQDLNTTDTADWDAAAEKLKEQKKLIQSYVMDEIFGKMESGEAAIAPYYAGDYLGMLENNADLGFVYPKEGTNIFVDSICIPKSAQNYDAAMLYIDFLLEPEIALANAEYICYASPNTAVVSNDKYTYKDNEILYPNESKMPKTQYFHDIEKNVRSHYESLWEQVKLSK